MPFNGAGTYSAPGADFPAVANTLIESGKFNNIINDIATALSTCLTKDGQTTVTANLPMAGFRHTGVGAPSARTHYSDVASVQDGSATWGGTSGGAADVQTLTLSPVITAYATGQRFVFIAGFTNTGAATMNVNGVGAKTVQRNGAALAAGYITTGKLYQITYDGTNFQLSNLSENILGTEDQILTGGVIVTSKSLGTISSGTVTPDPGDRPLQHYTNGGAHTLGVSANAGSCLVDITNDGSAGAITTSGFTMVTGDAFTTTNGNKFRCHISIGNGGSLLHVTALQ